MGRTACTEPQCLYKGALYLYLTVELYLYSPYGPYGLYRASVPVQGCTLPLPKSRAIPLLPLWAIRPVQSLSACTRVHLTWLCLSRGNNTSCLECKHTSQRIRFVSNILSNGSKTVNTSCGTANAVESFFFWGGWRGVYEYVGRMVNRNYLCNGRQSGRSIANLSK